EARCGKASTCNAGAAGEAAIREQLAEIAPVTAFRGSLDVQPWARVLPQSAVLEVGAAVIYVIHDIGDLDLDPVAAGFHAVVSGHSHRPSHEVNAGVHYVNPGSAGPRRFTLPVSAGQFVVDGTELKCRLFELALPGKA